MPSKRKRLERLEHLRRRCERGVYSTHLFDHGPDAQHAPDLHTAIQYSLTWRAAQWQPNDCKTD